MKKLNLFYLCRLCLLAFILLSPPISSSEKTNRKTINTDKEITILFLGDSITSGYGVAEQDSYPQQLKKLFQTTSKRHLKILNGSVSGSTTASALGRLKWFTKVSPDILFLALGSNDGLRGIDLNSSKKNLSKVITYAKSFGIKVFLAGNLLPPNYGEKYRTDFQKIFKDLSKQHSVDLLPFLLKDVGGEVAMNQPDGIHPNEMGHKKIAQNVYQFLKDKI